MKCKPGAFANAARALVGTPFRLRGRDPVTGIDCVGLILCALRAIGAEPPDLPHYTLRNLEIGPLLAVLPEAGFERASGNLQTGDLVLMRPSPGQNHLAIAESATQLIEAHAGLRRVVISPAPALLQLSGYWRLI